MADRLPQLLAFHEASPEDDFPPYAIAQEYLRSGDTDQALEWLAKTLSINPDHAYAYYHRALVLSGLDREQEADTAIQNGLDAAQRAGDAKAQAELLELRERD